MIRKYAYIVILSFLIYSQAFGANFYWKPSLAELNAITGVTNADKGIVMDSNHAVTFYDHLSGAWAVARGTDNAIDIVRYGASASDDNVSDSIYIQYALDSAVAGDEIKIPNGTYRITTKLTISTSYLKISCPGRATLLNIDNGTILEINSATEIEFDGCEFKGYSPAASTWAGTGVNLIGSSRIKFNRCIFNQLDTGIDVSANGSSNENHLTESLFNGISGYGVRLRNTNSIFWATNNTFQNGGNTGVGFYSGYNSGVKLRNNSFATFPIAVDIHGAQMPVLSGNYFENNDNNIIVNGVACTDAGCPADNSYKARNPLITGNDVIFKGSDDSFIKARNTRGMTVIGNWSSAQGAMMDVDNTVTMLTYIANVRDQNDSNDFTTGMPNNALFLSGDEMDSSTEEDLPAFYLPQRIYSAKNSVGGTTMAFAPDGVNNMAVIGADYLQLNGGATGVRVGTGGNYITGLNWNATASVADNGAITHGVGSTPTAVIAIGTVAGEIVTVPTVSIGATTFTVDIKTHAGAVGTTQTIYWIALK
mgnify:CR=1 FL=1